MTTHDIPASDALNLSVMPSPSSSLASLEDDPFMMPLEDYIADDRLPPDDTLHAEQSQSDMDSSNSQSDGSVKIHYHLVLDGMFLFFIYVQPY